jgi:anti-anti-sigma factor
MQAKVTKHNHYWIVSYEGDTAGLMPGPLPEVLNALQSGAHEIILDLSQLRFLSPNGVKAFRESLEAARSHEANIGITSPTAKVRRALKLSGLTPDIPIYHNEREAITQLDLVNYQESARTDLMDRLLIIQKNLPVAGKLRNALKDHPSKPQYRMIPVRDVKKAFRILLEEKVDCILIDAGFPLFQVTQFIENVETSDQIPCIPILIVSSDDRLDEAELMIRNGAFDIIRYPFQPVEVVVRLHTVISHIKDHSPYQPPAKVVHPRGWQTKS